MKTKYSGKLLTESVVTLNAEVSGQEIELRKGNGRLSQVELDRGQAVVYPGGDNDANHVIPQGALCLGRRGIQGISRTNGTHARLKVFNSFNGMVVPKNSSPDEIMDGLFCPGVAKTVYDQRSPNQIQIGLALVFRGKTTTFFDSADGQHVFPGDLLVICAPDITSLRKGSNRTQIPVTQLTPKLKPFDWKDVFFYHKNVMQWMVKQSTPLLHSPSNPSGTNPVELSLYNIKRGSRAGGTYKPVPGIGTKKSYTLQKFADYERGYILSTVFKVVETLVTTGVLLVNTPELTTKLNKNLRNGLKSEEKNPLRTWKHDAGTYQAYEDHQKLDDPIKKRKSAVDLLYDKDADKMNLSLAHLAHLLGLGDSPGHPPGHPISAVSVEERVVQGDCLNSFAYLVAREAFGNGDDRYACFRGKMDSGMKELKIEHLRTTMKYFADNREACSMHYRNKIGHRIIGTSMSYGDPTVSDPQIDILLTGGRNL